MNQQRLGSVADRRSLYLGVERNVQGLLQIGGDVHIDMADAFTVTQNRDAALLRNELDKLLGAARNNQVDILVQRQQFHDVGARLQQMDGVRRDRREMIETTPPGGYNRFIRADRFPAPFQNDGVSGFERQRSDLRHDIGPRLKHDPDHAERTGLLVKHQLIVQLRRGKPAAQGVRQTRDIPNASRHARDPALPNPKPLQHRGGHLPHRNGRFRGTAVLLIRFQNFRAGRLNALGESNQDLVALLVRQPRQGARCSSGPAGDLGDGLNGGILNRIGHFPSG